MSSVREAARLHAITAAGAESFSRPDESYLKRAAHAGGTYFCGQVHVGSWPKAIHPRNAGLGTHVAEQAVRFPWSDAINHTQRCPLALVQNS
jgi:hypothetical protein